jgi:hypothetical protein
VWNRPTKNLTIYQRLTSIPQWLWACNAAPSLISLLIRIE